jgi:hypothetical protein
MRGAVFSRTARCALRGTRNAEDHEAKELCALLDANARSMFKGDLTMITWSKDELRRIADADDLHISPFREDGKTYGTPTWIWSVVVDDAYRAKYKASPYLKPMIGARARSATVKLTPHATKT